MNIPSTPLSQSTFHAGLVQSRAFRNLENRMREWLAPFDVNLTEWALIGLLSERNHQRPNELAVALNVSPPMCTRIINKLEAREQVIREQATDDRRSQMVALTTKGSLFAMAIEQTVRDGMRTTLSTISREHLNGYLIVLEQLASDQTSTT